MTATTLRVTIHESRPTLLTFFFHTFPQSLYSILETQRSRLVPLSSLYLKLLLLSPFFSNLALYSHSYLVTLLVFLLYSLLYWFLFLLKVNDDDGENHDDDDDDDDDDEDAEN